MDAVAGRPYARDMVRMSAQRVKALGALRLAVGLALIAAPRAISRNEDPSFALLIRTIGIRDAVLGAGAVLAPAGAASSWGRAGLASDSLDVLAGAAALPRVGVGGGLVAALVPVPFAAAGAWALRGGDRG